MKRYILVLAALVSCLSACGSQDAGRDTAQAGDGRDAAAVDAGDVHGISDVPGDVIVPDGATGDGTKPDPDSASQELSFDVDAAACADIYPGQVVITELLVQPLSGAGTYIELYNAGDKELFMKGWVLKDGDGNTASLAMPGDSPFAPGKYLLVGIGAATFGGKAAALVLKGVSLEKKTVELRIPEVGILVDSVKWDGSWPLVPGRSMNLDPAAYFFDKNDVPGVWCPSLSAMASAGFGTPGAANHECPERPFCGDGLAEPPEDCDQGADPDEATGCTGACEFVCLDPFVDCPNHKGDCKAPKCFQVSGGQICGADNDAHDKPDDENPCTLDTCEAGQPRSTTVPDGTECDLDLGHVGDYCKDGACVVPDCGDGVKGPTEECDDGDKDSGDGCSSTCKLESCGNKELDLLEDCDDGRNGDDTDGCNDQCRFVCVFAEFDCTDYPGDCQRPVCNSAKNGFVCLQIAKPDDLPAEDGNPCTYAACNNHDPVQKPVANGLVCDNQTGKPGDYCYGGQCVDPACGDGVKGSTEPCDDGNLDQCDGCLTNCTTHTNNCGDGFVCGDEACDDKNKDSCDGCLENCTKYTNICGDKLVCNGEECDDGNKTDGDGCSGLCRKETGVCPADMVSIPAQAGLGIPKAFCMDRYEASKPDANATSVGVDGSKAISKTGVMPWYETPVSAETLQRYTAACTAAGKRMCKAEEWGFACAGLQNTVYSWGNTYNNEICNSLSSCCSTWCADHSIPEGSCDMSENCGSTYGCHKIDPTGTHQSCTSSFGVNDINGNVWELIPVDVAVDSRGFMVRGGAFNCGNPSQRLQCTFNATWNGLYAGFRCCKDL